MEVLHWFISGSPAINSLPVVTTYILLPPAFECNGSLRRDPFAYDITSIQPANRLLLLFPLVLILLL